MCSIPTPSRLRWKASNSAYYLIHSMGDHADFGQRDLDAARNFGNAARAAGVQHIIYLGGLGDPDSELSEHLRSRQQTGDNAAGVGVPVTEFRAGIIVGSGSVSFEMIRYLAERLPVMICPRWVFTRTQPIAIRDALKYLVAALETPQSKGRDRRNRRAGHPDLPRDDADLCQASGLASLHYPHTAANAASILLLGASGDTDSQQYRPTADQRAAQRSHRDGMTRPSSCSPDIQPMNYEAAVTLALSKLEAGDVETIWSDALVSSQWDTPPVVLTTQDGMLIEQRQRVVDAPPSAIYREFTALGGQTRLARLEPTLAPARLIGSPCRRGWLPQRSPSPDRPARWRCGRLLAG